jgi:hypothetical protein
MNLGELNICLNNFTYMHAILWYKINNRVYGLYFIYAYEIHNNL